MAKLTYWYAAVKRDSDCYSIVAKTKKDAERQLNDRGGPQYFDPIEKRTFVYKDAFDLFDWATSEGGGRGMGDWNNH